MKQKIKLLTETEKRREQLVGYIQAVMDIIDSQFDLESDLLPRKLKELEYLDFEGGQMKQKIKLRPMSETPAEHKEIMLFDIDGMKACYYSKHLYFLRGVVYLNNPKETAHEQDVLSPFCGNGWLYGNELEFKEEEGK